MGEAEIERVESNFNSHPHPFVPSLLIWFTSSLTLARRDLWERAHFEAVASLSDAAEGTRNRNGFLPAALDNQFLVFTLGF